MYSASSQEDVINRTGTRLMGSKGRTESPLMKHFSGTAGSLLKFLLTWSPTT